MGRYWGPFKVLVVAGLVVILALPLLFAGINRRDEIAGLNQEVRYDYFAFAVQSVKVSKTLETASELKIARGTFYIVKLKVVNHAGRASFQFNPSSPILIDMRGREFPVSLEAQRVLDAAQTGRGGCQEAIAPGAFCETEIVFDLPAETGETYLRVSAGTIGDMLDTIFYGKKIVQLPRAEHGSES